MKKSICILTAAALVLGAAVMPAGYALDCADADMNKKVNAADLLRLKAHVKGVSRLW